MDGLTLPPSPMQALQAEHERLLGRLDDVGGVACSGPTPLPLEKLSYETQALIHEARAYIDRSKVEAEWIHDARDRSQLRANLRFWAAFVFNCTGVYPDTTLRPARPFSTEYSGFAKTSTASSGMGESGGNLTKVSTSLPRLESAELEMDDVTGESRLTPQGVLALEEKPSWWSRFSRLFGLFAILIVGAIPLAAVCMALGLFYNLDNRSPWDSAGNAATQTAVIAQQLPSPTPMPLETSQARPPSDLLFPSSGDERALLIADVSVGAPKPENPGCTPVLALSLDGPQTIGGEPIPAVEFTVFQTGTDAALASGTLEPGAEPYILPLASLQTAKTPQDWLVQAKHPWLGIEAVIISGAMAENCEQNQITIVYRSSSGKDVWQQASEVTSPVGLDLSWKLLTWGPEALRGDTWVASMVLQGTGGNDSYVYFAGGDLAAFPTKDGLLPDEHLVIQQTYCESARVIAGVTSAGKSLSRTLSVQLVVPECNY